MTCTHEDIQKKRNNPLHHVFLYTKRNSGEVFVCLPQQHSLYLSSSKHAHRLRRERGRVTLCAEGSQTNISVRHLALLRAVPDVQLLELQVLELSIKPPNNEVTSVCHSPNHLPDFEQI